MNVLIPFYNVDDLNFYRHLVRSLQVFHPSVHVRIVYVCGEADNAWEQEFSFHKLEFSSVWRSKTLQFLFSRKKIFGQLKKINADVIFVLSDLWSLEFSSYCFRKINIPFVVWVRGDHRKVREVRGVNIFKKLIVNHLEVKYLNEAAFAIPNCLSLYEKLHEWGVNGSKITKPVYNGVDTEIFKPMNVSRSDKFTVGYAGRICPEKRVDEFLRIAEKLKNEDIKFVVAGPKTLEITFPENVQYLGKLPFEKMPIFYNMIDLLVLPSLTEGFPSVILEAYACEKPVLASIEAFPEELKAFGVVASLEEFEEEIMKLQRANLRDIGRQAREYVKKNFEWGQFANQIINYLEHSCI